MRPLEHQAVLNRRGGQAVILELKGPFFFGSADNLAREVEGHTQDAIWCILDMRRVNALDSSSRSADVVADEAAEVLELPYPAFLALKGKHPELVTKLILNMTLWLSFRMRALSEEVKSLEND